LLVISRLDEYEQSLVIARLAVGGRVFEALGWFVVRWRRSVLLTAVVLVVLGGSWGAGAGGALGGGAGLDDPHGESAQANALLEGPLGAHAPDVVVLYDGTGSGLTVDDAAYRAGVEAVAARIPAGSRTAVETFWSTGSPDFVSADRHKTYLALQLVERDEVRATEVYAALQGAGTFDAPGLTERYGGLTAVAEQFFRLSDEGMARAELLSLPLLLVLLLLVFGSVVAAALPMAVAVLVAVGSLAVLRAVGAVVELSTSAVNVVVVLGVGLATDYALLVVTRFREELAAGLGVDAAVVRATATAGRTVVVSAITVAIAMGGLLVFPSRFLRSMAWAGSSVVLFAALGAVTVLPALLRTVGHRVDAWRLPLPWRRRGRAPGRGWYRTAHAVMRRPVAVTVVISAALLALGLPLLRAE
jgi:RND superfamily putative drug exporter